MSGHVLPEPRSIDDDPKAYFSSQVAYSNCLIIQSSIPGHNFRQINTFYNEKEIADLREKRDRNLFLNVFFQLGVDVSINGGNLKKKGSNSIVMSAVFRIYSKNGNRLAATGCFRTDFANTVESWLSGLPVNRTFMWWWFLLYESYYINKLNHRTEFYLTYEIINILYMQSIPAIVIHFKLLKTYTMSIIPQYKRILTIFPHITFWDLYLKNSIEWSNILSHWLALSLAFVFTYLGYAIGCKSWCSQYTWKVIITF